MSHEPQVEKAAVHADDDHAPPVAATEAADTTTQFTDHGSRPPAQTGHRTQGPSASERGFGGHKKTEEWGVAETALQAAADIVQNGVHRMIAGAPPKYQSALWLLYASVTGRNNGKSLNGSERLAMLDLAMHGLAPAIEAFQQSGDGKSWLHDQLTAPLQRVRQSERFAQAEDRVASSVQVGEHQVVEMPDDQHPREQGQVLHHQIQKLLPTMMMLDEQVARLGAHAIEEAEHAMHHGGQAKLGLASLHSTMNVLMMADSFLLLSDEEFRHHLNNVHGVFNGIATYTELIKAVTELTGSAVGLTASFAAIVGKAAGDTALVSLATGLARQTGHIFGQVVAGIEIVHGIATLLDKHATPQQKEQGAVSVATGSAYFIGLAAGGGEAAGAVLGGIASTAVLVGYYELKLMANLYWQANMGIVSGWMSQAFETIQHDGASIAEHSDALAKAQILAHDEKDPEKAAAMQKVVQVYAERLGGAVDSFIDDCEPRGYAAGVARYPGAYTIFREAFAPVKHHKGAKTPDAAMQAGKAALDRITWALGHANELVVASAKQQHLADVEHVDAQKRQEHDEHH